MDQKEKMEHKTQRMRMSGKTFCLDAVYNRTVGRRPFDFMFSLY